MFNSPVLDIALGLIFIFLLYSLLATSISEALATVFCFRAAMLKRSIVENMLSDTPDDAKLLSVLKGILYFVDSILNVAGLSRESVMRLISRSDWESKLKLGQKFYEHPVIKNYGSSRIFPLPSYLPRENFSAVLVDVLKKDFSDKIDAIANFNLLKQTGVKKLDFTKIKEELAMATDTIKIKLLLEYYCDCYDNAKKLLETAPLAKRKNAVTHWKKTKEDCFIGDEISRILKMHLENSVYNIDDFNKRIETWFDDSMKRVTGWYKRQTQAILFVIGLMLAITFNVDTLEIAGKLSTDKNARDKLVQMAIEYDKNHKQVDGKQPDSTAEVQMKKVNDMLNSDIKDADNLLAIGWNGYGKNDIAYLNKLKNECRCIKGKCVSMRQRFDSIDKSSIAETARYADQITKEFKARIQKLTLKQRDSLTTNFRRDSTTIVLLPVYHKFYETVAKICPVNMKISYVWFSICNGPRKIAGYLILAFAVAIGSAFWFDLLGKLIKIRGSGKKEPFERSDSERIQNTPVSINVNNEKTGEEAVG